MNLYKVEGLTSISFRAKFCEYCQNFDACTATLEIFDDDEIAEWRSPWNYDEFGCPICEMFCPGEKQKDCLVGTSFIVWQDERPKLENMNFKQLSIFDLEQEYEQTITTI